MRLWTILLLSLSIVAIALLVGCGGGGGGGTPTPPPPGTGGALVAELAEGRRELRQAHRQVAERVAQSFSHHRLRFLIEPCQAKLSR